LSYYKQQLRWARGSLEVLFKFNPFFKRGLSFKQKIEYLSSALYYANGLIVLIDVLMPIQFFFTNASPVNISTTVFAFYFIPFMFLNLLTISKISNQSLNFQAISFSISSWTLQLQALWSILTNQKMSFTVTPKHEQQGNFLFLVYPHLFYFLITILGMAYSWISNGLTNAFFTNSAWALLNIVLFLPFIKAAYPWSNLLPRFTIQSQPKQA